MKKFFLFFSAVLPFALYSFADGDPTAQIHIERRGKPENHGQYYIPADQPDVFYNSGNQVIIIDGGGEVAYYDVEIESMTTWLTVISTQVSGIYDTIDVSSLVPDEYYITITSPTGNEFEGYFEIE